MHWTGRARPRRQVPDRTLPHGGALTLSWVGSRGCARQAKTLVVFTEPGKRIRHTTRRGVRKPPHVLAAGASPPSPRRCSPYPGRCRSQCSGDMRRAWWLDTPRGSRGSIAGDSPGGRARFRRFSRNGNRARLNRFMTHGCRSATAQQQPRCPGPGMTASHSPLVSGRALGPVLACRHRHRLVSSRPGQVQVSSSECAPAGTVPRRER